MSTTNRYVKYALRAVLVIVLMAMVAPEKRQETEKRDLYRGGWHGSEPCLQFDSGTERQIAVSPFPIHRIFAHLLGKQLHNRLGSRRNGTDDDAQGR